MLFRSWVSLPENQPWVLDSRALSRFVHDVDGDSLSLSAVSHASGGMTDPGNGHRPEPYPACTFFVPPTVGGKRVAI